MSEQFRRKSRIGVRVAVGVIAAVASYCLMAAIVAHSMRSRRLFGLRLPQFFDRILDYTYDNAGQLLSAVAVAFTAFCVWLTVRFCNRRERWAKWTLAAALALPVLYVASFGPACWIMARAMLDEDDPYHENFMLTLFDSTYWPIGWCAFEDVWQMDTAVWWYGELGMPKGTWLYVPGEPPGAGYLQGPMLEGK